MDRDTTGTGEGPADALDRALRAALKGSGEGESVLTSLERRIGSRSRVSLREEVAPPTGEAPRETRVARRYLIADELGRGGVGVVLRGRDEDLGREVALKFLRPERLGEPVHVNRFLREAQIEGQLQHPGIVPVYELGVSLDGRPFFAMKLVRGETLATLLAARASPEHDRRRFLGIFEQVCHAMAYAHARGVVHRDLKPANVMLGRFGEVQVVDWGFAKVLGAPTPGPEADASQGAEPDDVLRTHAGSMMGTPPYMPPEQAGRRSGPVDERADVFALGAILIEILTGEPAYRGPTNEVLRQALDADLSDARARLDACGADPALIDLCRACLHADPADRPRDAGVVTERLSAYLTSVEDRARRAELDAASARVRAEGERRARRLTVALAGAVVLAGLLGSAGWLWVTRERREQADRASRDVARALGEGRQLLATARRAPVDVLAPWDAALSTARAAWERAGSALESDRDAAEFLLAVVETGRDEAMARKAEWDLDQSAARRLAEVRTRRGAITDLRDADMAYAEAFRRRGIDLTDEGLAREEISRSGILDALVAAIDDWSWVRTALSGAEDALAGRLRSIASAVDPDPHRRAIREAAGRADGSALRGLGSPTMSPEAARLLGRRLSLAGDPAATVDLLRRAWRRAPEDFWTSFELAEALTVLPQPAWGEAVGFYRAALAANPASRGARARLASALRQAGRVDEAVEAWRAELRRDPADPTPYRHLLDLHRERGDLPAAMNLLEEEAQANPTEAGPRAGLGIAFLLRREWPEAVTQLEQAVAIEPTSPALRTHLAEALLWSGRQDAAREQVQRALDLDRGFALGWEMLHRIELVANDTPAALAAIREAVRLGPDVPICVFGLAAALRFDGRLDEARALCDRFVELCPFEPMAHEIRGVVLLAQRDLDAGAAELDASIRLVRRGLEAAPWGITQIGAYDAEAKAYRYHCVPGWDPNLGPARAALAMARMDMGDPQGALAALDVLPWDATMGKMLAWVRQRILLAEGRVEEALPLLELLADDTAATDEVRYNLGMLLVSRGDAARAREALASAHRVSAWSHGWSYPAEDWARDVEALVRIGSALPAAVNPGDLVQDANDGVLLGLLLHAHGRQHASMQVFDATFVAAPDSRGRLLPWPVPYPACVGAAQSALLSGWGVGRDAHDLSEAERAGCRRLALSWMREGLESMRRRARTEPEKGPGWLRTSTASWLSQGGYALAREEASLRRLPAAEADAWRDFWREVRASAE